MSSFLPELLRSRRNALSSSSDRIATLSFRFVKKSSRKTPTIRRALGEVDDLRILFLALGVMGTDKRPDHPLEGLSPIAYWSKGGSQALKESPRSTLGIIWIMMMLERQGSMRTPRGSLQSGALCWIVAVYGQQKTQKRSLTVPAFARVPWAAAGPPERGPTDPGCCAHELPATELWCCGLGIHGCPSWLSASFFLW